MGLNKLVVFLNKADAADKETIELVEMEVRDLLEYYKFPSDAPIVVGSALLALEVFALSVPLPHGRVIAPAYSVPPR